MITVTERAAATLQHALAANDIPAGLGVKLLPRGPGSIGLAIAAPRPGDEIVRYEQTPVLIVDRQLTAALAGTELDCTESEVDGHARIEYTIRPAGARRRRAPRSL